MPRVSPSVPSLQPLVRTAIVGSCGIGKTSLIQSFMSPNGGDTLPATTPTIGAAVVNHLYTPTIPLSSNNGLEELEDPIIIRHTIWDTAGQESYKSLVPLYTRNCDILIIAFPANIEPQRAHVQELLTSALPPIKTPQIVKGVLTKCDLVPKETCERRRQKLAQYIRQSPQAQRRSFDIKTFTTSALTGEGVEECFITGLEEVAQIKVELKSKEETIQFELREQRNCGSRYKCC